MNVCVNKTNLTLIYSILKISIMVSWLASTLGQSVNLIAFDMTGYKLFPSKQITHHWTLYLLVVYMILGKNTHTLSLSDGFRNSSCNTIQKLVILVFKSGDRDKSWLHIVFFWSRPRGLINFFMSGILTLHSIKSYRWDKFPLLASSFLKSAPVSLCVQLATKKINKKI